MRGEGAAGRSQPDSTGVDTSLGGSGVERTGVLLREVVPGWTLHKGALTIGCAVCGGIKFQGIRAAS